MSYNMCYSIKELSSNTAAGPDEIPASTTPKERVKYYLIYVIIQLRFYVSVKNFT